MSSGAGAGVREPVFLCFFGRGGASAEGVETEGDDLRFADEDDAAFSFLGDCLPAGGAGDTSLVDGLPEAGLAPPVAAPPPEGGLLPLTAGLVALDAG